MKKDAYYFSHDSNAQDDPKMMILIDQMGMEGYGIFWALIEKLRAEAEYKLPLIIIASLARRWGTSKEKVETVVRNYGLFVVEDDAFFSMRLVRSMQEKTERARKSISYRWQNTNVLQPNNDRSTTDIRNDTIKGKESKGKNIEPKGSPEAAAPGVDEKKLAQLYRSAVGDPGKVEAFVRTYRPSFVEPYVNLWNHLAHEKGLSVVKEISESRRKKIKARAKEKAFDFPQILEKAREANDFLLLGKWFTFDWVLQSEVNYLKVLEGNYDKVKQLPNVPTQKRMVL